MLKTLKKKKKKRLLLQADVIIGGCLTSLLKTVVFNGSARSVLLQLLFSYLSCSSCMSSAVPPAYI